MTAKGDPFVDTAPKRRWFHWHHWSPWGPTSDSVGRHGPFAAMSGPYQFRTCTDKTCNKTQRRYV